MRLWTIHPEYLDNKQLSTLWRDTLLAKNVLSGLTKHHKSDSQLNRFQNHPIPRKAINFYLSIIWEESQNRNMPFDESKFSKTSLKEKEFIEVNTGQVSFEFKRLKQEQKNDIIQIPAKIKIHPLFKSVNGPVEVWEKQ